MANCSSRSADHANEPMEVRENNSATSFECGNIFIAFWQSTKRCFCGMSAVDQPFSGEMGELGGCCGQCVCMSTSASPTEEDEENPT